MCEMVWAEIALVFVNIQGNLEPDWQAILKVQKVMNKI